MNARIEKKLSKRLVQEAPNLFKDAWQMVDMPSLLADNSGSNITNTYHVGGGVDYWSEGCEAYSVWEWWADNAWCWHGNFPSYPAGHKFEHSPNTEGFKPTVSNLIKLAKSIG